MMSDRDVVTVGSGQSVSSSWVVLKHCIFTMVLLPVLTAGTVTLEVTVDDSNYYPVLGDDGTDLVVCANGSAPGWRDISDYIRGLEMETDIKCRLNTGAAQAFDRSIVVLQRAVS